MYCLLDNVLMKVYYFNKDAAAALLYYIAVLSRTYINTRGKGEADTNNQPTNKIIFAYNYILNLNDNYVSPKKTMNIN